MATQWMTFEEVQEYLGHARSESTEVWLSRHGIRPERHYRRKDVLAEREGRTKNQTRSRKSVDKRLRSV